MQKRTLAYTLTLAAVTFGALGTAAMADRMRQDDRPWPMIAHGMAHGGPGFGPGFGPGGPGAMMDFDALDADKDGKVTAEELAAHRKARIDGLDANADGRIDAAELVAMQMREAEARAKDRAERMIEMMDADGDGALGAAELLAMPMPGAQMLERLDADGDGAISKAEFDAAMQRMEHGPGPRGERGERGHGPKHGAAD